MITRDPHRIYQMEFSVGNRNHMSSHLFVFEGGGGGGGRARAV